ncbi:hypothetical protein J6X90_01945 [Candidatus Saccharibacteria bacterium]|nr:hypothetical protein [Candidatus Saccharibacteria bacterium]
MKKAVRKKNYLPIVVLVLGILLGGSLIGLGIYNNVNSDYDTFEIKTEDELKTDVEKKLSELEELKSKREEEFNTSAESEEYEKLSYEISEREGEVYDLEAELANTKNGLYNKMKQDKILGSVPLIVVGAAVIVFAVGLAMRLTNTRKKNVILTVSEEK